MRYSVWEEVILDDLQKDDQTIKRIIEWIDSIEDAPKIPTNVNISDSLQSVITNHFPQYQKVLDFPDKYRLLLP